MTGMGQGLKDNNPTITAAFRSALDHQFLIIVIVAVVLALAWNVIRTLSYRRAVAAGTVEAKIPDPWPYPEPAARRHAPDQLRDPLAVRRAAPGAELDAGGPARRCHHPGGEHVARMGAAPGQRGHHHLDRPSGLRRRRHRVDPGRHRIVPAGRPPGLLVAERRSGERGLGPGGVGVRRGVRRHLRSREQLALRISRGGPLLCRRRRAGRPARLELGEGPSSAGGCSGRRVRFFIGMGVLQAWPGRGFWSGQARPGWAIGDVDRHGRPDGPGVPAVVVRLVGPVVRHPSMPPTAGRSISWSWWR